MCLKATWDKRSLVLNVQCPGVTRIPISTRISLMPPSRIDHTVCVMDIKTPLVWHWTLGTPEGAMDIWTPGGTSHNTGDTRGRRTMDIRDTRLEQLTRGGSQIMSSKYGGSRPPHTLNQPMPAFPQHCYHLSPLYTTLKTEKVQRINTM